MDNRDILHQLCSKLDDEILKKLATTLGLWTEINALLRDTSFWKARTGHVWGYILRNQQDMDWKYNYYMAKDILCFRLRAQRDYTITTTN